ncbi:type IV pilus modification PilV family protein [Bythopirellula goksoeyrii]|uniref:Prepilin-type N-terminal cleavage/methylation domain-containing protein n=1 Tax=Bythopirellula goksoeyrii TaxID=1400387 RepID=A0A5B9Q6Q0_9BACT|nr:hypothetical protein [Bythopirellula goksoeyrii]QEG34667.1 hypothetical protein Pr1d_19490 [Bythopirellula goksoeyrii]
MIRSRFYRIAERPRLVVVSKTGKSGRPTRHGITMTELLVAATLLIGAMSFAGPLAVRSGRLQQDARHYQSALEEVSNQLERLTALEDEERERALADLTPSPIAQASLPNPQLSAETIDDFDGLRLVIRIQWDRLGQPKPLELVGWIEPPPLAKETP